MSDIFNRFSKEDTLTFELASLYEKWGYSKYRMAKFEEYSFYSDNRDFLTDENVIAFNNSDGRLMALKPDITLSIVKNAKLGDKLTKLYYNESVFRLSPQTKDFREIKQTGVELLGEIDNFLTAQAILLGCESLEKIDENYSMAISHMAFIPGVISSLSIPDSEKKKLVKCVRGNNAHDLIKICSALGVDEEKTALLTSLLAINGDLTEGIDKLRKLSVNEEMKAACDELTFIAESLSLCGLSSKVKIDLTVMNNIDYYNGIIFQGYVSKAPARVLSGGRYDNLVSKIRADIGAIGFAVYLDGLNLYYGKTRQYDYDIAIVAEKRSSELLAAVNELALSGKSVVVCDESGSEAKARRYCRFDGSSLTEVEKC